MKQPLLPQKSDMIRTEVVEGSNESLIKNITPICEKGHFLQKKKSLKKVDVIPMQCHINIWPIWLPVLLKSNYHIYIMPQIYKLTPEITSSSAHPAIAPILSNNCIFVVCVTFCVLVIGVIIVLTYLVYKIQQRVPLGQTVPLGPQRTGMDPPALVRLFSKMVRAPMLTYGPPHAHMLTYSAHTHTIE